jgi:acetyl esterase/lipase
VRVLGLALATVACVVGLVAFAPTLTRAHWIAGLVVRETSLALALMAAGAWLLVRPAGPSDRAARMARVLAGLAVVAGLLPFLAQLRVFPGPRRFSPREYALGALVTPRVAVRYDVAIEGGLKADVYRPAGPAPHPFVVFVHGGGWRNGDKGEVVHLARELAAAGYAVFDVQYRLAPAHPFPAAVADVKCLLGRLRERAGELGIDGTRSALLGRSAGGQIALLAAYSAGDARLPPACSVSDQAVAGVIAFYAPTDLAWAHDHPMRPDVISGNESLRLYLGGTPRDAAEAYRLASPLSWTDRPALPSTLLLHGGADQIVRAEHSRRLEAALRSRGHHVGHVRVPFGEHGMDARPGGVAAQLTRHAVLDFLEAVFAG